MNLKVIKVFVIAAFLFLGSFAFLSSGGKTDAQTGMKSGDETLDKIAVYKTWSQVQKPPVDPDAPLVKTDAVTISNSVLTG